MYNFYRENWLVDRLRATASEAFGEAPCVFSIGDLNQLAMIAVGPHAEERCPSTSRDAEIAPEPTVDDYPFLYLRNRGIPGLYLLTLTMIALTSLVLVRAAVGRLSQLRPYLDLFALGAAFLLLETKSVVQFALWFGTTWVVNAMVFAGILLAVLAAIGLAKRLSLPPSRTLYGLLLLSLTIAWLVPPAALLQLGIPARWVAATVLTFTPVFIANLIFAQRFSRTASTTAAFGANLLGAMLGGILEYAALITGYRGLIILAAVIYSSAFLLRPREIAVA
jgi:hypothetical protein